MATNDDDTLTRRGTRPLSPSEMINGIAAQRPHRQPWELNQIDADPPSPDHEPQPPPKKSDPLPRPGDKYRAHARFLNRLSADQRLIHFVLKDFTSEGFAYADLRRLRVLPAADPGQGPVLLLRFVEAEITDVRIEGRNLEDIHYWIGEGAMPWVWEQPDGFRLGDDKAAVITRITIGEAKRRMSGDG